MKTKEQFQKEIELKEKNLKELEDNIWAMHNKKNNLYDEIYIAKKELEAFDFMNSTNPDIKELINWLQEKGISFEKGTLDISERPDTIDCRLWAVGTAGHTHKVYYSIVLNYDYSDLEEHEKEELYDLSFGYTFEDNSDICDGDDSTLLERLKQHIRNDNLFYTEEEAKKRRGYIIRNNISNSIDLEESLK